jgi:hypothetical protein
MIHRSGTWATNMADRSLYHFPSLALKPSLSDPVLLHPAHVMTFFLFCLQDASRPRSQHPGAKLKVLGWILFMAVVVHGLRVACIALAIVYRGDPLDPG